MSPFLRRTGILILAMGIVMSLPLWAANITPKDIDRSYGFTCSGTATGGAPVTLLGQVSCESKHNTCSATFIQNVGGNPVSLTGSGPFTLDKETGLGQITYDVGPGFFFLPIQFVVIENGREIRGMPTRDGDNVLCTLRVQ